MRCCHLFYHKRNFLTAMRTMLWRAFHKGVAAIDAAQKIASAFWAEIQLLNHRASGEKRDHQPKEAENRERAAFVWEGGNDLQDKASPEQQAGKPSFSFRDDQHGIPPLSVSARQNCAAFSSVIRVGK